MPSINAQQQLGPVTWNILEITGRLIDLTGCGTPGAFGAHSDEMIQRHPIIGMFENGGKGLKKPAWPIGDIVIFDMISNLQLLRVNHLDFFL